MRAAPSEALATARAGTPAGSDHGRAVDVSSLNCAPAAVGDTAGATFSARSALLPVLSCEGCGDELVLSTLGQRCICARCRRREAFRRALRRAADRREADAVVARLCRGEPV